MSEKQYSKRQVNMMRVNALRSASSEAKNIFIAYLCGVHTLYFYDEEAKNYPEDYYAFKRVVSTIPVRDRRSLHGQINTYRAAQILKLLGTSVDNKKLSFLTAHYDPLGSMSAKDVLTIIKKDLAKYKLLLDVFICNSHRETIRSLRVQIKEELGMNNEEIKGYKIFMTIPSSVRPFVNAYRKQEKERLLANSNKPQS
ncbi:hypothetical protein [Psychrobacter immobilis]|uniref:hypothetical protein n=1 Tax=Psychrobacter immobilis TaxID=498 RepID=UPI0019197761|nr:hypothetical protein [Psychrobacter immobilis]